MKRAIKLLAVIAGLLVVAFVLLRTPDTDPAQMRAKYGGEPSQFIKLANGLTVHLRDEGSKDAPALVLLHGSNADLHTWQPWTDLLKARYRIIRFDQRGHGLTGPASDGDYSTQAFVEDVDEVADALSLKHFVLVGNSMGGGIALGYAIAHPARLDGLVLVDAAGAPIAGKASGNLVFTLARIPLVNRLLAQITPRSLVKSSFSQSVANQAVVTDAAIDRYWELARYPGNRKATLERFSLGYKTYDADQIEKIKVPTLILWGEKDSLIPFAAAHWFARHLSNSTLKSYPDLGHIPMEEGAERSAKDLESWLGSLGEQTPQTPQ